LGWGNAGFRSWVRAIKWCARGRAGWSPKPQLSYWGSIMAQKTQGASVSGRGDLSGVREVQMRGVEVVIELVRREGGLVCSPCHPFSLPFSYPFPTPKSPLKASIVSLNPPGRPGNGHVHLHWVVVEE